MSEPKPKRLRIKITKAPNDEFIVKTENGAFLVRGSPTFRKIALIFQDFFFGVETHKEYVILEWGKTEPDEFGVEHLGLTTSKFFDSEGTFEFMPESNQFVRIAND